MRVLLTGGTGTIGSRILPRLLEDGHQVFALVRSPESASAVHDAGATALMGDITDVEWLTSQLRQLDGAIHTATDNSGPTIDAAVTDAVIAAFEDTDKPFVHTGGIWVWGNGFNILDDDPQVPPQVTSWRGAVESKILNSGVKVTLIAPGIVYGPGGAGIASIIADGPRDENGTLTLLGSGDQHWTTVAVDDLAELYVLALERSPGHVTYLGVSGENPTVREIGEAAVGPDAAVAPGTNEEAGDRVGPLMAEALLLDQQATGVRAKNELGWEPNRRSLVGELAAARERG